MGAPIGGGVAFDGPGESGEDPATGKATQEMEMVTIPMRSLCRIKAIIGRWSEVGSRESDGISPAGRRNEARGLLHHSADHSSDSLATFRELFVARVGDVRAVPGEIERGVGLSRFSVAIS